MSADTQPRPIWKLVLWAVAAALAFAGLVALGTWQVHRRSWKLDLIARVDQRVHAPPVAPPPRSQWPHVDAEHDEYLHVCADGELLKADETLVKAVTRLGPGDWVLTPLRTAAGDILLINRGFVDAAHRNAASHAQPSGNVQICGLLRISEPRGAFLHHNDPATNRWYSRDVAAIAAARKLPTTDVAPYFIDADATPNPGGWPVGGLTVIRFHNSHLVYAITWYALALMVLGGAWVVGRHEWRGRRGA